MQISFHGAVQTVTGSQHLIPVGGKSLLLDCGLYQGKRDEARHRNRNFLFEAGGVEAVVLSHAHIDHSGNLSNLVKQGFRGKIICTTATADLCGAMLLDSGHIQEEDVQYVNRQRRKHGEAPVEPIYTRADAAAALQYFVGIEYERPYPLWPGATVTLYDAGHMLGSAIVALDFQAGNGEPARRLVFTGDLGRPNVPLLRDPYHAHGRRYPAHREHLRKPDRSAHRGVGAGPPGDNQKHQPPGGQGHHPVLCRGEPSVCWYTF